MKTKYFIVLIFILIKVHSQSPDWEWSKSATGTWSEVGNGVTTDNKGNAYVTGTYNGNFMKFSDYILENPSVFTSFFVVKYDYYGNVKLVKSAGSYINGNVFGRSITSDVFGNIYVVGDFSGSFAVFDDDTIKNTGFESDIFIVKYDSLGNIIWLKGINGNYNDNALGINIDSDNSIYVTGYFKSDSLEFGDTTVINPFIFYSASTPFIAKLDSSGKTIWTKIGIMNTWSGISTGKDISIDSLGSIYLIGAFNSDYIDFDNIRLYNPKFFNYNIFIVKYDSNGNVNWARSIGGIENDEGNSIAVDKSGHIYITGTFQSPIIIFEDDTLFNSSVLSNFIIQINESENSIKVKNFSYNNFSLINSVTVDNDENVYMTGYFNNSKLIINNDTLIKENIGANIFIVKYDSSGNILWLKNAGGKQYYNQSNDITVNNLGNVYVTGYIQDDPIIFGQDSLHGELFNDFFITKLSFISVNPNSITICKGDSITLNAFGADNYLWNPSTGLYGSADSIKIVKIDTSMIYTVKGFKDEFEAQAVVNVNVFYEIPSISRNGNYLISSLSEGNQWYLNDTVIPDATSRLYSVIQNGIYNVCVTNTNGCTFCSESINISDYSYIQDDFYSDIVIYPNPSNGFFSISSKTNIQKINILNILGELIFSTDVNSDYIKINLLHSKKSLYFVQIFESNKNITLKKILIAN